MEIFSTLPQMVQYMMNTYSNSSALNYPKGEEWETISTEGFLESIRRFALGLHSLGLEKGDVVGMVAPSSIYWLIVDLAVISAGGISVPLFPHLSEKNFLYESDDCKMKFLVVLDPSDWPALSSHRTKFNKVITRDAGDGLDGDNVLDFSEVMQMGDKLSKENPQLFSMLRDAVKEEDVATIIYTSGSSGTPKGVELTHRNLVSQVIGCGKLFKLSSLHDRTLSMLPLAHIFERMLMYSYLAFGVSIYIVDDLKNLTALMQRARPTIGAMVPLIVEKIFTRIQSQVSRKNFFVRFFGKNILNFFKNPPSSPFYSLMYKLGERFLFKEMRKTFGGAYRAIIVGGAPLDKEMCQFFINAGIPMYQGYGLTEASPVLSANFPNHNKPGTVGPAVPSVELKIIEEEILAKGPNIMKGYHGGIKGAHVRVDEEGWLHTGDLGFLDEHGFLTITGRVKEIMKTSAGKMVTPLPIETALLQDPLVEKAMIVANEKKFVAALLFPNFEELNRIKKENGMAQLSDEDFLSGKIVEKQVSKLLDKVNQHLNAWEKVKAFRFIATPLSMEKGELTPTLKINRLVVLEKYKKIIQSMYLQEKG